MPSLQSRFYRRALRSTNVQSLWGPDLPKARRRMERIASMGARPVEGVTVRPGTIGDLPVEMLDPFDDPQRFVVYLHGGGYVTCSPTTHRALTSHIAYEAQARVLVPAYRLAPEHPFPAGLDDALATYRSLIQAGVQPGCIAIGGDSAGGGLALATALTLRDSGEPLPAALFLISPWTDLTFSGDSAHSRAHLDPILQPGFDGVFSRLYAGERPLDDPLISPVFADLHGLPPTLIQVGTHEILYDDSTRLEQRMNAAGTHAQIEVWDGMWHVFQAYAALLPESLQAIDHIAGFLRGRIL